MAWEKSKPLPRPAAQRGKDSHPTGSKNVERILEKIDENKGIRTTPDRGRENTSITKSGIRQEADGGLRGNGACIEVKRGGSLTLERSMR